MPTITGDRENNRLRGKLGESNILLGLTGDDVLLGQSRSDTLHGDVGNDRLFGGDGSDQLRGGSGNDYLNGDSGSDRMEGGHGNDIYVVNVAGDRLTEQLNSGRDTVQSLISWTLGANVENLRLLGRAAIDGTGNRLGNLIIGNAGSNDLNGVAGNDNLQGLAGSDNLLGGDGNDVLIGGLGEDVLVGGRGNDLLIGGLDVRRRGRDRADADQMFGGLGNDTYYLNLADDSAREELNSGIDTAIVLADFYGSSTHTLGEHIENVRLIGSSSFDVTGNDLNNFLTGNSANNQLNGQAGNDTLAGGDGSDRLSGGRGNDVLTGGSSSDQFVFTAETPFSTDAFGLDTVTDFTPGSDRLVLSQLTFGLTSIPGAGFSLGTEFASVLSDAQAQVSSALIVFSRASGQVFYNPNREIGGFGATGASGAFVAIAGASRLEASDVIVV